MTSATKYATTVTAVDQAALIVGKVAVDLRGSGAAAIAYQIYESPALASAAFAEESARRLLTGAPPPPAGVPGGVWLSAARDAVCVGVLDRVVLFAAAADPDRAGAAMLVAYEFLRAVLNAPR